MASLRGSAGGSKQNSNVSISLTSGNLREQLESIKDKAKIAEDAIENIVSSWSSLQDMVSENKITLNEATDMMKGYLSQYDIKINDTTKNFENQKVKIKEVETQSKESTKEEIRHQEAYAGSIDKVNRLLSEQANLLNKYRLSATNKLTPDSVDKIITKIGMNLNSGRSDDKIRHDILEDIGYAGTLDSLRDGLYKNFDDTKILKRPDGSYASLKDFIYSITKANIFSPKEYLKDGADIKPGKYKYDSDISRGLKNPNILPDINDLLAMAVLNADEFENYAKNTGYYDDLMGNYERFQARLWNSGSFKGTEQDFIDMTDIADRYLTRGTENRNTFMKALGLDYGPLRKQAMQTKNDIIKAIETGIYDKAQITDDIPFGDFDDYTPNTSKQLPALNYIMDYENRMRRRSRALYNLENNYAYGNDLINAYGPQYSLNLPVVVEGTYREITNNVDKINQITQQTASEIASKAQQATTTTNQATKALEDSSKSFSYAFGMITKVIQKTKNDLTLTFRDLGNATRTISSVMYSAIHLAQALENVMNISDSMTAIAYRLERYDNTGASRQTLLNTAFNRANNARSDIDSYATLAQRILATNVTNGNADEAMRIASLITKSMVLGGSTAQEQKSAQLQLSQALASNILGGDELRAIRENAIGFTEMLARGLTRGYQQGVFSQPEFANVQIGDLKGLGKKQLLTADVVTKAISLMEDEINKDFSTMPELFSQTMSKLMNTFKKRLNEFNQEGKGLSRIVKLFQDLEKWINSDKGKQALDKLMNILDSFVGFLENLVKGFGFILDKFSGPLMTILKGYLGVKPYLIAGEFLLGKTDINGNSRAGLFGYGGILKYAQRLSQGAGLFGSLLGTQNINGETVAFGGLFQNILSLFNKNSMTNKRAETLGYLNSLLRYSSKPIKASDFKKLLNMNTDISPNFIRKVLEEKIKSNGGEYFREGALINAMISNKALKYIVTDDRKYAELTGEATDILTTKELMGLATNTASTTAGTSVGNAVTNAMAAKGGIIGKAMGFAAAHPIATAIAALIGIAVAGNEFIRKPHLEKAYNEDLNSFLDNLPNPAHWSKLQDEDRTALRNKAAEWHKKYTEEGFWNINRTYSDKDYEKFVRDYLDFGDEAYGKYLKSIADNTGETASNTASTLDITDEFIRNMNDIRTRSFRGELLMNGNGVNNTWNVVVHNEGDVKNIAEQIQSAVIAAQEGMLNTPVVM